MSSIPKFSPHVARIILIVAATCPIHLAVGADAVPKYFPPPETQGGWPAVGKPLMNAD